ncbi:MAG: arginine decarboxylase, pyruvoyl-dependent [Candidatus Zixiibacteriota bacterium]|nr:MAG: arginine decarboxylase, pyruvoyl-dependent [candidate division Zixibacteria bacterium]
MIHTIPKQYFIVAGTGEGFTPLVAFDAALGDAGIRDLNLVKVSSIVPPGCQRIELRAIAPGSLVPIAYASKTTTLPGEVIAAGVAVGIPEDDSRAGIIMEYSALGHRQEVEEIVTAMARQALESRGVAIRHIECRAVDIKAEHIAAAFAGVVLL